MKFIILKLLLIASIPEKITDPLFCRSCIQVLLPMSLYFGEED